MQYGALGIDTAGPVIGVGFYSEHVVASWEERITRGADAKLMPKIQEYVSTFNVEVVAVSIGPGAFTGLRVGIASALGVAMALGKLVVPVSALMARAALIRQEHTLSLLDARKKRVYAQHFDGSHLIPKPLTEAVDAPLQLVLDHSIRYAVGEGAIRYKDILLEYGVKVPPDSDRSPALEVARLGWLMKDSAVPSHQIQPQYIRSAGVTPPKGLGVALGTPSANRQEG